MSFAPIVQASLDAQLAELAINPGRVAVVPTPSFAWGHDLSCDTDCDDMFSETPQNSPLIIAQSVLRRFQTSRGAMLDDGDYGFNLFGYLNRGVTQDDVRTLQRKLTAEAQKDERVETADVTVTVTGFGTMSVSVGITPADPTIGAFRFVFAVDGSQPLIDLIGA